MLRVLFLTVIISTAVSSQVYGSDAEDFFTANVLPNLTRYCGICHKNPTPDYETAKAEIVPGAPEESPLYLLASGQADHRKVWGEGSTKLQALYDWIMLEAAE